MVALWPLDFWAAACGVVIGVLSFDYYVATLVWIAVHAFI